MSFSVVIPVYNEAETIGRNAALILEGLPADAEIIFACNGCSDGTPHILKPVAGDRAQILVLDIAGKALAIRAAERYLDKFPRFFVDADVTISGSELASLAATMAAEGLDLISPRTTYDLAGASWAARAVHKAAASLPHHQEGAFHGVLGVSRSGRSRWGEFPDVLADDTFIEAQIPPTRKRIDKTVRVIVRPPRNYWAIVRVRERWDRGLRELRSLKIKPAKVKGQRRTLLRNACSYRLLLPTMVYISVRASAFALRVLGRSASPRWYRDPTSRSASS